MKIVVTAPTGNIGQVLTGLLLEAGAEVVLLCRNPEKVKRFTDRGARAAKGSMDDVESIKKALEEADSLFWLTPPDFTVNDFRAYQNQLGRAGVAAIRASGVKKVVNLSSVGAQHDEGTGPIKGLHDVERILEDGSESIVHLRAAFFFENFLMQAEPIKTAGSVFMPVTGTIRAPMVATRDIARVAADKLLDSSWSGRHILGVHGPADLSFNEAAEQLSEGLRRPVKHVKIPEEQARETLEATGATQNVVNQMLELYRGIESGHVSAAEPRTPETTTPTALVTWAREVMLPIIGEPPAN
jgi:uncharacterized protein YbjT (DUF2867 family)